VLDHLATLADPTRSRLLLVLERHELTVSELCAVLQLPQSTVSRHLRILGDDGWVAGRAEGTSRQYRMVPLEPAGQRLWNVVREEITATQQAEHDAERLRGVLAERRIQSREFFSSGAGRWDTLRAELFGARAELAALPAFIDPAWVIGDLGCGTGHLTAVLAPFVRRVIAVDENEPMLAAARARLEPFENVELRQGSLEALPIAPGELDAAILSLVLHHALEPADVLREAARTLKPNGRLLIVDMVPHAHDDYRQQMGHVWLGFSEAELSGWLADAGFGSERIVRLPADPAAKGPNLLAASAVKRRHC